MLNSQFVNIFRHSTNFLIRMLSHGIFVDKPFWVFVFGWMSKRMRPNGRQGATEETKKMKLFKLIQLWLLHVIVIAVPLHRHLRHLRRRMMTRKRCVDGDAVVMKRQTSRWMEFMMTDGMRKYEK